MRGGRLTPTPAMTTSTHGSGDCFMLIWLCTFTAPLQCRSAHILGERLYSLSKAGEKIVVVVGSESSNFSTFPSSERCSVSKTTHLTMLFSLSVPPPHTHTQTSAATVCTLSRFPLKASVGPHAGGRTLKTAKHRPRRRCDVPIKTWGLMGGWGVA